ncbi:MAG: MauE/DoxX family redox-associated membrane protein [Phenylobacterium sp.]|uniref:MauE/DoxX family redox-associated membrane protein n=1 Tax=Phenylobacterium sp. TaxID=1871053 RepID=UPI0027346FBE|nr:MauE/DoxX family redox-associated membrane protein [Phenylobacterium sp.]MDP3748084.1 MauE/DoxX family redox-associated membrane protein [Phenylobacterium sp.]
MAALALFLALVLALSAGHKLLERERLAAAATRLAGVDGAIGPALSLAAAAIEGAAALALVLPGLQPLGGAIAALLWTTYGLALWRRRGMSLDCGCTFAARQKPVDGPAVARAAALAGLALAVAAAPSAPFSIETPFAALALLALYLAFGELAAIPATQKRKA